MRLAFYFGRGEAEGENKLLRLLSSLNGKGKREGSSN